MDKLNRKLKGLEKRREQLIKEHNNIRNFILFGKKHRDHHDNIYFTYNNRSLYFDVLYDAYNSYELQIEYVTNEINTLLLTMYTSLPVDIIKYLN
jgi:hypothetical protein